MIRQKKSAFAIDALGNGDISLAIMPTTAGKPDITIVGIPKRQARALANRILHEIDYAEGRRLKRPSTPHLPFIDLQPCMDCGRKNATACAGRHGRACPLISDESARS